MDGVSLEDRSCDHQSLIKESIQTCYILRHICVKTTSLNTWLIILVRSVKPYFILGKQYP